jgi:hypothetical protein
VLLTERRDTRDEIVWDDLATGAQFLHGAPEIDGVPQDDGGDGEIEAGSAISLIQSRVKRVRSRRPISRMVLASAFCFG